MVCVFEATKDVPDNFVLARVLERVIGSMEEYYFKNTKNRRI